MTTFYASLVATVGANTSNSYCTVAEADDYHDGMPTTWNTDWTGATTEIKEDALMWATRLLDAWVVWHGVKADISTTSGVPDQRLEWPRDGVVGLNGEVIDSDVLPQWLKEASAELARNLVAKDLTKEPLRGFTRIRAGDVEIEFDVLRQKRVLLKSVRGIIWPYGDVKESAFGRQAVRV